MALLLNDQTKDTPKLCVYLNLDNLIGLDQHSAWGRVDISDAHARDTRLMADGFEGVQLTSQSQLASSLLPICGASRIDSADDADSVVQQHQARGDTCLTVHVGTGLENEIDAFHLTEAVLKASQKHLLPVFIETHRATITQDLWRTVRLTQFFPEIRFNADFSHYYCGQEMPYGDWAHKLEFMQPIFDRVGFMHGRVASSGCMQVPIEPEPTKQHDSSRGQSIHQEHFHQLWTCAVRGFLRSARTGDVLIFAPELLDARYDYARVFPGAQGLLVEECDRYAQALIYQHWIRHIFEQESK